jgi:hypothetical protein
MPIEDEAFAMTSVPRPELESAYGWKFCAGLNWAKRLVKRAEEVFAQTYLARDYTMEGRRRRYRGLAIEDYPTAIASMQSFNLLAWNFPSRAPIVKCLDSVVRSSRIRRREEAKRNVARVRKYRSIKKVQAMQVNQQNYSQSQRYRP